MSHLVHTMAYANELSWHGLGNKVSPHQPIEVWQREAGMDWQLKEAKVMFNAAEQGSRVLALRDNPDAKVLFRSDTLEPLSVVSPRYKVVQPSEILEFYRDLVAAGRFEIETAGVLKSGRKIWALARTGQQMILRGGDRVKNYLLLATSCDGSLATTAQFTSVRVVCNNTLQIALEDRTSMVRIPHRRSFDPNEVKEALGLGMTAWDSFKKAMHELALRPVNRFDTNAYFVNVLGDPTLPLNEQPNQRALQSVHNLFKGQGKGANLPSSHNTAWGLLNAVTEYVDHHRRARSQDYRLDSAWFGNGADIKARAMKAALKLAA